MVGFAACDDVDDDDKGDSNNNDKEEVIDAGSIDRGYL